MGTMSILLADGNRRFTIKWTCQNLPYIDFADEAVPENLSNRIYLRKADVVSIIKEMQEFVDFYAEDFSAENINTTHKEG
jgi:phosphoribulokinase